MTDRTDGSEPGLSSEDLIRQARAPYEPPAGEPRSTGTTIESNDYPAPPTPETALESYAPDSYAPQPERVSRPADGLSGDPIQPPPWDGVPQQAAQPSVFQRYGKLMLFGAIGLGIVLFGVLDKTKNVEDLAVGDCLLMPDEGTFFSVESTDCGSDHQLEVFALVTLPDDEEAPYPGDELLWVSTFEECLLHFERYVGIGYEQSKWEIDPFLPTPEGWADDDRGATCTLALYGSSSQARTTTGSARGSGE